MSVIASNRDDVERTQLARRRAREETIVRVIKDRYVVERIMRLVRSKATRADDWRVEVRLTWSATRALQSPGFTRFAKEYIYGELRRRGFDLPVKVMVMSGAVQILHFPHRASVLIIPAA